MTYSILDSPGNLVDAFEQRDPAVAALRAIVQVEPEAADVVMVAQEDEGEMVGETIYWSSLPAAV
jgi:hypothetical protein